MTRFLSLTIFSVITMWFLLAVLLPASQQITHGFAAYYVAAKLLTSGNISAAIYDPAYFRPIVETTSHQQASDIYNANPPTTSLLFLPISFLPIGTARTIWTITNAFLLWGGVLLLIRSFSPALPGKTTLIVLSIAMLFQPAIENIRQGQAYLLIFMLLTVMVITYWRNAAFPSAFALSTALLLKTSGWLLLPLLGLQRRWRYLSWTVLLCAVIIFLTLSLFPLQMWQQYLSLLQEVVDSPQVCAIAYQTTRSFLCQLFTYDAFWSRQPLFQAPWLAQSIFWSLALVTIILTFAISRQSPLIAVLSMIIWGVLFSPVGEQYHHTVILIPLVWLILQSQPNYPLFNLNTLILASGTLLYLIPLSLYPQQSQSNLWIILAYPRLIAGWLIWLALLDRARTQIPNRR